MDLFFSFGFRIFAVGYSRYLDARRKGDLIAKFGFFLDGRTRSDDAPSNLPDCRFLIYQIWIGGDVVDRARAADEEGVRPKTAPASQKERKEDACKCGAIEDEKLRRSGCFRMFGPRFDARDARSTQRSNERGDHVEMAKVTRGCNGVGCRVLAYSAPCMAVNARGSAFASALGLLSVRFHSCSVSPSPVPLKLRFLPHFPFSVLCHVSHLYFCSCHFLILFIEDPSYFGYDFGLKPMQPVSCLLSHHLSSTLIVKSLLFSSALTYISSHAHITQLPQSST
jgi:hypothetical protein